MLVYIFVAITLWRLDAPWWVFVLFILCDFVDDFIYENDTTDDSWWKFW